MNALVTGGTGFIGSRVVGLLLEHGHNVRLFSRRSELPSKLAGKNISLYPGDLRDADSLQNAMNGMDALYHIGEIKNTSSHAAKQNVRIVERVIDSLGTTGIRRVVFISSISVAGVPSSTPATEDTSPSVMLRDHYTRYKEDCEKLLAENASGATYAVVRPGVVYGPGSRYLGSLVSAIDRVGFVGIPFIGKGDNVAPLIHVNDLARAVYLAGVVHDAAGQVFNLTDGLRHSWADFFNAIAGSLRKKLRILSFPPFLLKAPALFLDSFSGLFNVKFSLKAYVSYVTADLLFDNSKARRCLNWSPEYALARGVQEMVREYTARR